MMKKMNNKKAIKAISIVLSAYMALSPMAVYADELSDAESAVVEQVEVKEEAAEEHAEDSYDAFEDKVASFDNEGISFEDPAVDVSNPVEDIENEAIKDVVSSITDVDMTKADDALEEVSEIVDAAITDETVASEIEATADTLIAIYDMQATTALNALTEMNVVTVMDDGTVAVDWNVATVEVTALYNEYQVALEAKDAAQKLKDQAVENKDAVLAKADPDSAALDKAASDENKETITNSKQDKNDKINELIASVAKEKAKEIKKDFSYNGKNVDGSADIYRFFINTVDTDGTAYGCLTYYDSAKKIILRKNFKITSDEIVYNYVPQPEWVKSDTNTNGLFGNGGNYIAAYVENKNKYIDGNNEFKGKDVSELMRLNVALNNNIDVLDELEVINADLEKVEQKLQDASTEANIALEKYKNAVEMYRKAATLESEVRKSEVEKAKLEYVKAEVEAWRRQQTLNQIKEAINNAGSANEEETDNSKAEENIETVVNSIASNLGVEPASIETMVVQAIIDAEEDSIAETNDNVERSVAGARRNDVEAAAEIEEAEVAEEIENANVITETELDGEISDTPNEAQKIVTIEENQIPLANLGADAGYIVNWWLLFIIALTLVAWMIFVVFKKNQKKEEANI
ncbi:MAG: hypothetical protein Q4E51_03990 [Lachnospiraceae bacterium]|nr:hypothetical protein [Lachnospiraceae bacterium]